MAKQPTPKLTTKKHMARLERERRQTRTIVYSLVAILVIVVGVIIYGVLDQTYFKYHRTVAKVGNQNLTIGEFQAEAHFARYLRVQQYTSINNNSLYAQFYGSYLDQIEKELADPQTYGQSIVDQMVENAIIDQEAAKLGITISDKELEDGIQQAFGFYANGTPTPVPTGTPWSTATLSATQLTWLPPTETPAPTATNDPKTPTVPPTAVAPTATPTKAGPTETPTATETPAATGTPGPTSTPYTVAGFKTQYADYLQKVTAVDYNDAYLRAYIKHGLLRKKLLDAVTKDVPTHAEQIWARHILVATEADANTILNRLKAGDDWVKLAAASSTDTSNKDKGGDLGWFGKGQMVAEFETAAYALKVGEISAPVKTSFGYHIIQLLGREDRPLSDTDLQTAKNTAFTTWLTAKKTELKVQTFSNWLEFVPTDPPLPTRSPTAQAPQ
jgi:peptidyl-prolyl cis-trans isomerase D